MFSEVFVGLFVSSLLGAFIGAQREIKQQKEKHKDFAGFRTFTLISVLGYLIGLFSFEIFESELILAIGLVGIFSFALLAYRTVSKLYESEISIISEVVAIITFVLGVLVSLKEYHLSISLAIFITAILFLGTYLHSFAKKLTNTEIFATLKFALISLVILPFLPNKNYSLLDIPILRELVLSQSLFSAEFLAQIDVINPYTTWILVILISAIAFVGYILMKTIGAKRGMLLTGFLGGLMSSTALTSSFSIESKRLKYLSVPLAVGTIIAGSTMFVRVLFEVAFINSELLPPLLIPFTLMMVAGVGVALYFYKKEKINHVKNFEVDSPFTLKPALGFAVFFVLIIFLSNLFSAIFGEGGVYAIAFFSGIADVDAITISLSALAKKGEISNNVASTGIIIAALSNSFFKVGIAYVLGSKYYSKKVLLGFLAIFVVGILSYVLI